MTFQLAPQLNGYDEERGTHLYQELLDRLRGSAGVTSAAVAAVPILSGNEWDNRTAVEGHNSADGEDMQAYMNALSPDYFKTMQIPILEGRDFTRADVKKIRRSRSSTNGSRRISSVATARWAVISGRAEGQVQAGHRDRRRRRRFVVEGPREGVRRQVFIPTWGSGSATIYVRTTMGSSAAFALIRREVRALDRSLPVFETKTVQAQLDETLLTDRLVALLSAGFGMLATLLASIGLYGVMAFVVARRRKELGIRVALGAQRSAILWSVMQEVLILLSIGLAVGIPTALGLGRFVSAQLYGIEGRDPSVAVATILLLTIVSALAGFIPAHRASSVDPMLALRYE